MVRPLACRERMPRGPLSVILRGSKLLAAKQVVKSAIVILCGGSHLSWIQDPDVIRVHPLFRALCLGANTSVVDSANCHWYCGYLFTYHFLLDACAGHHNSWHPWHCILTSPHSLCGSHMQSPHASVTRKVQRVGYPSNYIYATATACFYPMGLNSRYENREFSTV